MKLYLTSFFARIPKLFAEVFDLPPAQTKVAFIANASDPYPKPWWVAEDRDALVKSGFQVIDVELKNITTERLEEIIANCKIIFVAGGNVAYLLKIAKQSGLFEALKKLPGSDKIYVGSSAGSILAGPSAEPFYQIDKKDLQGTPYDFELKYFECLGFVDYLILPHYNQTEYKTEIEKNIIPNWADKFQYKILDDTQSIIVDL